MKYIKLFEDFNTEYEEALYTIIKKAIIKLHYDTNRPATDIADLLVVFGLSEPMAIQVGRLMSNNRFNPEKVDNYIENIINLTKFTKDKPVFTNLWGQQGT